jgi:hypothetical protein
MTGSKAAGTEGERIAEWALARRGWRITEHQVIVAGGHRADLVAVHPDTLEEWIVEVKVWNAGPSGKDTVKKAIADAYDLAQAGETRPYLLVLSHPLAGLLAHMITRARRAGVINDVVVVGASQYPPS